MEQTYHRELRQAKKECRRRAARLVRRRYREFLSRSAPWVWVFMWPRMMRERREEARRYLEEWHSAYNLRCFPARPARPRRSAAPEKRSQSCP